VMHHKCIVGASNLQDDQLNETEPAGSNSSRPARIRADRPAGCGTIITECRVYGLGGIRVWPVYGPGPHTGLVHVLARLAYSTFWNARRCKCA